MRTGWAASLVIALCLLCGWECAYAQSTIVLPADTKRIEAEAFLECTNMERVILPEGVTHIGARAFAYGSLTEIVLPESIVSIAEDAFEGCLPKFRITADRGTYAYEWAQARGYLGTGAMTDILVDLEIAADTDNCYAARVDVTESFRIEYSLLPAGALDDLEFSSTNQEVADVDQNGLVKPVSAGSSLIYMRSPSTGLYKYIRLTVTGEHYSAEGLTFAKTVDGKGYLVAGCAADRQRVFIPAAHNGQPVMGIVPGAFRECAGLTDIRLEAGHTVLYMENDALYADLPQKTLLCYPGKHDEGGHYYISDGTEAVAAYAFAQSWLSYLTVPDSLVSIGDCAFYSIQRQLGVFFPTDSTTGFGETLFQNQLSNGYFFTASWESPAAVYANKYGIPCGVIIERTPEPTAVPTPAPAATPMPELPAVDESKVVIFDEIQNMSCTYLGAHCIRYDISSLEGDDVSEVRMEIQDQWRNLKYYPGVSPQTGLYGAGYTGQAAVLRAYDAEGKLIGAKNINGHFTFSFEGARMLGVAGGKGTKMTVVPTEPVFVDKPGRYPIRPDTWHQWTDGNIYQYYILKMHLADHTMEFPQYLNILGYHSQNCITGAYTDNTADLADGYTLFGILSNDGSRTDRLDQVTLIFDRMECLLDNAQFSCYATTLKERSDNLGESIYRVYQATREQMLGRHYPSAQPVKKVQVRINGQYPGSFLSIVTLDDQYYIYDERDVCSLSHELTHAIDQGLDSIELAPSAWLEGRAEYISMQVCEKLDAPYTSVDYGAGRDADWSLVSAADREDFYRFYYESSNRQSQYMIGYYFYDFLIDTYGEDVGARIMENIAEAGYDYWDHEKRMAVFKECVESATEEGVFQRFVRDVIEPSGT